MSTILDSLKKSSDKRDDSNKSSMDNFSFSRNSTSRNSKSYVLIILLLLTIGILYFGYLYLYSGEIADTNPSSEQALVEIENTKLETPNINNTQSAIANAPGEINKKEKPDSNDVKQRIKEIKARRKAQQEAQIADASIGSNADTKNSIENNDKNSIVNEAKEMLKTELQKKSEITLTMPGETNPSQASQEPVARIEQKHLYVYQLPFSIRKDIPKLKLNIHVYDKDPENRIAIINGVRFAIDDLIDDVVLVKDIIPEGVLLEFNNRVFLVPK